MWARSRLNYTQTWACPYAHAHGRLVSILHFGAELLSYVVVRISDMCLGKTLA